MGIFRKHRSDEDDPVAYARAHVTSPGAHALLDEVERGQARRAEHEGQSHVRAEVSTPAIRAQLTEADWALLHMMRGSHWGPGATLVLPSGIRLTGDEVARLLPSESGTEGSEGR